MTIVDRLIKAREAYNNGEESLLTDSEYDILEEQLKKEEPAHKFFTGIGAEVRGDKLKLPYPMGSLTQLYENDFTKWVIQHNLKSADFVMSEKFDGVSALVIYDQLGEFQIAYSRGDGREGQDISRHIIKIPNVPKSIDTKKTSSIRGEVIISVSTFKLFIQECKKRNYKLYKNPRNTVAGILNSKENPDWVYKYLEFFAFELIGNYGKKDQFVLMRSYGLTTVDYIVCTGLILNDNKFESVISYNKKYGLNKDYEQDGLVIDVNNINFRNQMTKGQQSLNPEYARKFKIRSAVESIQTTVIDVLWSPSKNRLIKPRILMEPININGVTITHTNGFNAKYIIDNKINIGSKITMIRSGDVIPYLSSVDTQSNEPNIPSFEDFGEYKFNETKVDFILLNETKETILKGTESFFTSLEIPSLKEGTVKKLYESGYCQIQSILIMSKDDLIQFVGKNGNKIYDGIEKRFENITQYDFMGSLPCFVGIGKRMFEKLYNVYGTCSGLTVDEIAQVDGFEYKTAYKIADNYYVYYDIMTDIGKDKTMFTDKVSYSGKLDNTIWVFTGFRDKDSQEIIIQNGGTIGTSIKKETTYLVAKDPNSKSSKFVKADKLGVKIISIDEMLEKLEEL